MSITPQIGAGLAIGFAGLGVAIGQGKLALKAMEMMGKNPRMNTFFLTVTILGLALVESSAIYGLIVAFQILSKDAIDGLQAIGIGLAVGLAGLGVGIGEGELVGASIDAMNNNPDNKNKIMTYMILFLALVESAAIYGLVISFQMLGKESLDGLQAIGTGLAVGVAGLGVGVGEGLLAKKSMENIGKNFKMANYFLTVTILGIALTESAAIYGLIVAFQILGKETLDGMVALGVGASVGFAGLGVGIGEGLLVGSAIEAMSNDSKNKNKIMVFMILFLALVESAAIYGLVISFQMLGSAELVGLQAVGAGLAVGLAGLGVGVGEGILAQRSLYYIGKNFNMSNFFLTVTILGIALTESAAIYGLVVAFSILGGESVSGIVALGAGLAIGLAGLGAGVGEGFLVGGAFDAMNRNPANKNKTLVFMVLFLALVEVIAIYGLIIAFNVLG